ncbi:hypothetical protein BV25DRAFT_1804834 [Artomyces pyxidatus]|uniref:Uncharacterized protein n=1 Tax=Artomyces pyxidatus TaxID=48021 RepID=A0ACB8SZ22_9AGAM|nr:hypothetical protein BV25DRAFT_1804834 [Artomyces pyxidatus]
MLRLASRRARYTTFGAALCLLILFTTHLYVNLDPGALRSSHAFTSSPQDLEPAVVTLPRILLVSAFFPLPKSKHSLSDYHAWLTRFLAPVTTHLYFFCPPNLAPLVRELRGDLPMTLNTSFTSPFDIPPLRGLEPRYEEMHGWDRESKLHSPELYAVWNCKAFFLDEGVRSARAGGVEYHYAFWSDAGSMRDDHTYRDWPGARRVQQVFEEGERLSGTPRDQLIFFPVWGLPSSNFSSWTEPAGPVDEDISEGSFFGGTPDAIAAYRRLFYTYHDLYLERSLFVGKDQTLINALFLLHPAHFFSVWFYDRAAPGVDAHASSPLGSCGGTWWYYQWWIADQDERERMADIWALPGQTKWTWASWWSENKRCQDTRILTMVEFLKRAFGVGWAGPHASVEWETEVD